MYYCNFPNCNYKTEYRSQINHHHIVQESDGGSDKDFNRVYLCPNHHTKIYIPEAKPGSVHHNKGNDSMIIEGTFKATCGKVIIFKDFDDNIFIIEEKNS